MYWDMMRLPALLTVFFGVTCAVGAEGHGEPPGSTCDMNTDVPLAVTEGEALRVVPDGLTGVAWNESQHHLFTWRREQDNASIASTEDERVHYHGPALFFLPLSVGDTGLYVARLNFSGQCYIFHVTLHVMSASTPLGEHRLYTPMEASDSNSMVTCPEQVADLCKDFNGDLSWYRNSSLIPREKYSALQLQGPALADVGMYTCNCTWRHRGKLFYSTASRELQIMEKLQFIQPKTTEMPVQQGSPLELVCVAFVGTNVKANYEVWWEKDDHSLSGMEGYSQKFSSETEAHSKKTFCTSILTISKVQGSDLAASFRCRASNLVETRFHSLRLKPAASESRTVLVVVLMCVSIVFLLAALAIKLFAVDLVLFFRRFRRCTKATNNGSQYDVYVVHRSQPESKGTLNQFLSQALPLVLEQQCGYRVFIQGRDSIPGEDRLEQVKEKVGLSRRLMVVFSPGLDISQTLGASPDSPAGADIDWQVGLQQALAQDTRVILVQLGEVGPQGYTQLSPSLQQLIHKGVPLCWLEDSPGAACWKSRFWKRVRYAMPITSTKPSSSSSVSVSVL